MKANYLIRFDDLNDAMNWPVWDKIEQILEDMRLRPILAVVPDNRDLKLRHGSRNPDFWDRVRDWQSRGWTIGLHGYQHLYVSNDAGITGLNRRGEFAGLDSRVQKEMLTKAVGVFQSEGVRPDIWVAPAHSFDAATISILRELSINVISDGFSLFPFVDQCGTVWVPQQLWHFRPVPFGIWTVCLHHNSWGSRETAQFERAVQEHAESIVDLETVLARCGKRGKALQDSLFGMAWLLTLRVRSRLRGN